MDNGDEEQESQYGEFFGTSLGLEMSFLGPQLSGALFWKRIYPVGTVESTANWMTLRFYDEYLCFWHGALVPLFKVFGIQSPFYRFCLGFGLG
jgi:hypothetical protein